MEEIFDLGLQLIQLQENVLRVPGDRRRAVNFASRISELQGLQKLAAEIALVAAGISIAATGALAFHKAICKK